jgi:hypothetical protein
MNQQPLAGIELRVADDHARLWRDRGKSPKLTIALPRSTAGSTKEAEALLAELT